MLIDFSESARFEHGSMYGPDLSKWPADVFDAFSVFHFEENRIQNARIETDREMMRLEAR